MEARRCGDQDDVGFLFTQHRGVVRVRGGHLELFAEFAGAISINVAGSDELDSALGEFDGTHMRLANSTRANENSTVSFHTEIIIRRLGPRVLCVVYK